MDQVIALVDMDCFFVQVEQRYDASLKGKPCAVVQYTQRGVILAVSYEARPFGVKRGMTMEDAKVKCPDILLPRIPELRGKADLTKYRDAGAEVIEVFSQFCQCVERASIDEAYLDLTKLVEERIKTVDMTCITSLAEQLPNTHVVGWDTAPPETSDGQTEPRGGGCSTGLSWWLSSVQFEDIKLVVGALIVSEMREAVFRHTGFTCSAGISRNKMLAKLAAGLHKPNQQTVLPHSAVEELFKTIPIHKVRNLGGKLGEELKRRHGVEMMSHLWQFSKEHLVDVYGSKTGLWLHGLCRGHDAETVTARQVPKSIGCSKNFLGKAALDTTDKVKYWLTQLATEVEERLIKDKENNKRSATSMVASVRYKSPVTQMMQSSSRTAAVVHYTAEKIAATAFALLQQFNLCPPHQASWSPPLLMLSISVGKFVSVPSGGSSISSLLKKQISNSQLVQSHSELYPGSATTLFHGQSQDNPTEAGCSTDLKVSESVSQRHSKKSSLPPPSPPPPQCQSKTLTQYLKTVEVSHKEQQLSEKTEHLSSNSPLKVPRNFDIYTNSNGDSDCGSDKKTIKGFFSRKALENSCSGTMDAAPRPPASSDNAVMAPQRDTNTERNLPSFFAMKQSQMQKQKYCQSVELTNSSVINDRLPDSVPSSSDFEDCSVPTQSGYISVEDNNSSSLDSLPNDLPKSCDSSHVKNGFKDSICDNGAEDEVSVVCRRGETDSPCDNIGGDSCEPIPVWEGGDGTENLDYVDCQDCGKKILVWNFPEHQDYHFAEELQRTVNKEMINSGGNTGNRLVPGSLAPIHKRRIQASKTSQNKRKKSKTDPCVKTLEVFFQRK
ncbi:DNA polymerase eta-like [Argonauta hians]